MSIATGKQVLEWTAWVCFIWSLTGREFVLSFTAMVTIVSFQPRYRLQDFLAANRRYDAHVFADGSHDRHRHDRSLEYEKAVCAGAFNMLTKLAVKLNNVFFFLSFFCFPPPPIFHQHHSKHWAEHHGLTRRDHVVHHKDGSVTFNNVSSHVLVRAAFIIDGS